MPPAIGPIGLIAPIGPVKAVSLAGICRELYQRRVELLGLLLNHAHGAGFGDGHRQVARLGVVDDGIAGIGTRMGLHAAGGVDAVGLGHGHLRLPVGDHAVKLLLTYQGRELALHHRIGEEIEVGDALAHIVLKEGGEGRGVAVALCLAGDLRLSGDDLLIGGGYLLRSGVALLRLAVAGGCGEHGRAHEGC